MNKRNHFFIALITVTSVFVTAYFVYEKHIKIKENILIIGYGQSLVTGMEGWPAITTNNSTSNTFMIGESVRPDSRRSKSYNTIGTGINHIHSVSQKLNESSVIMSTEDILKLKKGDLSEGEEPIVGAVTSLSKFRYINNKNIFGMNAGVSGFNIIHLGKGSPYYQRFTDAVSLFKRNSDEMNLKSKVSGIVFMQGEANYDTRDENNIRDKEGYGKRLGVLFDNMIKDSMLITGQKNSPLIFTYQTGGKFSKDDLDLSIGMAQLEVSNAKKGVYLVGPTYQYPDKNGHLDPNSYRWFGVQIAKVMRQVIDKKEKWEPLQPKSVLLSDGKIVVNYNVPRPPLKFSASYVSYDPVMYKDKGFTLYDSNGRVYISSVEITAQDEITITPVRKITGPAKLFYADKTYHNGNGNVSDSDDTVSPYKYEYKEGSGQYAESNIKELVGKPYPLNNFSVAFCLEVSQN